MIKEQSAVGTLLKMCDFRGFAWERTRRVAKSYQTALTINRVIKDIKFYEFLWKYHQRENRHNPKADLNGSDDLCKEWGRGCIDCDVVSVSVGQPEKQFPDPDQRKGYMQKHLIPDVDFSIKNFVEFMTEREKPLCNALKKELM